MIVMSLAHLASVDLNLLVALAALLEEGNVTRAARRVGVTQSAMSHSLSRLRELLGDPLFVRAPRGIVPTTRAAALGAPLRKLLEDIDARVLRPAEFDPSRMRRTFVVSAADYLQLVMIGPLVDALAERSPDCDLSFRGAGADDDRELDSGAVELVLGTVVPQLASIRRQRLLDESFVCVVREGHPEVRSRLTLKRWLTLRHVQVAPRGAPGGVVDRALAQRGLSRRVSVRVPSFVVAPHLVATSDLVLTCPARLAHEIAPRLPLRVFPPPVELPGFTVWQMWHERLHTDPEHAFLRQLVIEVARGL